MKGVASAGRAGAAPRAPGAEVLLLAVESATSVPGVAVLRGEELLVELAQPGDQHHAETLLPLVDRALAHSGLELDEIEAFGVSIGPGSFTSLRIGLATVKGLVFGTSRPAVPVSTLKALSWTALCDADSETPVVALLDARRGEAYAAGYALAAGGTGERDELEELLAEGVYTPAELAERIPGRCRLVGEGAALFGPEICALRGPGVENLAERWGQTRASAVGRLAVRALARGEGVDATDLAPRYVRRAEAEVKRTDRRFEDPA
jgi:tRNA threonylcarbamoyladenosine biosynthesis protein TsaB